MGSSTKQTCKRCKKAKPLSCYVKPKIKPRRLVCKQCANEENRKRYHERTHAAKPAEPEWNFLHQPWRA